MAKKTREEFLVSMAEQGIKKAKTDAEAEWHKQLCIDWGTEWTGEQFPRDRLESWIDQASPAEVERCLSLRTFIVIMESLLERLRAGKYLDVLADASVFLQPHPRRPGRRRQLGRTQLLRLANTLRHNDPQLSKRQLGKRLEPFVGISAETIRKLI
ncbi:MAG: hypothetical protein GY769_22715 [bacterium]|nr:hypothetical protein [bacterium]